MVYDWFDRGSTFFSRPKRNVKLSTKRFLNFLLLISFTFFFFVVKYSQYYYFYRFTKLKKRKRNRKKSKREKGRMRKYASTGELRASTRIARNTLGALHSLVRFSRSNNYINTIATGRMLFELFRTKIKS